ncbi:hypothetical protein [uncultured Bradyrhizobium sp.]|uniref:hypothetical protein n=1 Tax=Bradyrhizobium sp. TaxID=376 RepID=UPI002635618A|nr:hypothetical protein [uncultured Bradyrhizobium sp.]
MATLAEIAAASTIAQISYLSPDSDKMTREAALAGGLLILRGVSSLRPRAEPALGPIRPTTFSY